MNQDFTIKKVGGVETVGDIFHEKRRRNVVSLEDVAKRLRIQTRYLRALERGDYKELPADVYTRGFVKSYAEYLGLDSEAILKLYKTERNIIDNVNKKNKKDDEDKEFKNSRVIITPRLAKVAAVIIIIAGLFFYLWFQISGLSAPPKLTVKEPLTDKTISEDSIVIIGETKSGADVTINGQSVYVDTEGNFKESVALQIGLNNLRIVAANKLDKENIIERKIMVERDEEVVVSNNDDKDNEEDTGEEEIIEEMELKVSIRDLATWIHVEEDGKVAYSGTMLPDSEQTFKAKDNITLSSGKANSTYVTFNGKDIGALGDSAEAIRDMNFTKEISL